MVYVLSFRMFKGLNKLFRDTTLYYPYSTPTTYKKAILLETWHNFSDYRDYINRVWDTFQIHAEKIKTLKKDVTSLQLSGVLYNNILEMYNRCESKKYPLSAKNFKRFLQVLFVAYFLKKYPEKLPSPLYAILHPSIT